MLAGKRHRRPVSRVLSDGRACARSLDADTLARTVISLGVRSPVPSSSLPAASWSRRATSRRLFGLAPAGVYPATPVARRAVRSYRTISTLPDPTLSRGPSAVSFLWHCPSHPRDESRGCAQALPGSLPCGARTFLDRHLSRGPCRDRPAGDVARRNIAGSGVDRSRHRRGDERAVRGHPSPRRAVRRADHRRPIGAKRPSGASRPLCRAAHDAARGRLTQRRESSRCVKEIP